MKRMLGLLALVSALVGPAYGFDGFSLEMAGRGRLLVPGESIGDFTARLREEITCVSLQEKYRDYQDTRAELDRAVKSSFDAITRSLDAWDAELWRWSGHAFRYTGALGAYARKVSDYGSDLELDQLKLQVFATTFESKLAECYKPAR